MTQDSREHRLSEYKAHTQEVFKSWLEARPDRRVSNNGFSNGAYFLTTFVDNVNARSHNYTYIYKQWTTACHMELRYCPQVNEESFLVIGVNYSDLNEDMASQYLKWLLGRTSPWYSILGKNIKRIKKNGTLVGIRFLSCPSDQMPMLRNFAIAVRMIGEKPRKIRVWRDLVNLGMSPNEAFWCCTFFSQDPFGTTIYSDVETNTDHWPISIHKFEFDRFIHRKPATHPTSPHGLNHIWHSRNNGAGLERTRRGFLGDLGRQFLAIRGARTAGRFTTTETVPVSTIAETYYAWRDRNGLKGVRTRTTNVGGTDVRTGGMADSR